jgi:hypothetical protein
MPESSVYDPLLPGVVAKYGAGKVTQTQVSWQFGLAHVTFVNMSRVTLFHAPHERKTGTVVTFRREGEAVQDYAPGRPAGNDKAGWAILNAFMLGVLATGRTCEVGAGVGMRDLGFTLPSTGTHIPWKYLLPMLIDPEDEGALNLSPDYQRGAVWTEKQQRRFIGHALEGGAVPLIYVHRDDLWTEGVLPEVIDGQQRLRAIAAFMQGLIPGEVYDKTAAAWRELWYRDFDEIDRRARRMSVEIVYGDWSRERRLEFYLRLNGGVAHTDEELGRVRRLLIEERQNGS